MNILILGPTGFIGNALFHSLISKHQVTLASRTPITGYSQWKFIDFAQDNDWDLLLDQIDLVINAIGIIEGDFDKIQTQSPLKLFQACVQKKIKIINLSAVGAEKENPPTSFLKSKKIVDQFLLGYDQAKVIYPGIVIGKQGKSTQFFTALAQFPIIPLLTDKPSPLIHITQLIELIQDVIDNFENYPQQVFAISKPEPLKNLLTALKGKRRIFVPVPSFLFSLFFTLFPKASVGMLNKDMLAMLSTISTDDYKPRFEEEASKRVNPRHMISSDFFSELVALLSISFIWIWSGVSSLVSWEQSYGFMQEVGANHQMSNLFIYLGSFADIVLGCAVFWKRFRKEILLFQLLFILIYTLILSVLAPHYWMHPFGVLSKNIPLIALTYYLYQKLSQKKF